ncbi:MAG: polyprenyl diphosphate synthase [Acidimicrobiia bacterium]
MAIPEVGALRAIRSRQVGLADVVPGIDPARVPRHVAIVMDGNGRWAKQRGLARIEGHAAGEEALFDTVEGALEVGLSFLTVFAFSTENWRRPQDEVEFIMRFNEGILVRRTEELHERGVRIRFCGRRGGAIPESLMERIHTSETRTSGDRRLDLVIAFNYGGRAELADAARDLAREAVARRVDPESIDEAALASRLYLPGVPDPDLLVRTSGEHRISNYLLWQLAYAELYFTDVLWPDFRRQDLFAAVRDFQSRERRFGRIEADSTGEGEEGGSEIEGDGETPGGHRRVEAGQG